MQADWEFEIGSGAPVIDAAWSGLVDLRVNPDRIGEVAEAAQLPAMGPALLRLNSPASPVWTSKCDVWLPESIGDPDELEAQAGEAVYALACYIDLLPCDSEGWSNPARAEAFCRRLCGVLGAIPARCCRADLVVRGAMLFKWQETLGITAYLTACGASQVAAASTLSAAVSIVADSLCTDLGA